MKMLKHLFGKRDKELDVLQEEALQSPLRTVVRNFTSNRLAFGGLIVFLVIFLTDNELSFSHKSRIIFSSVTAEYSLSSFLT